MTRTAGSGGFRTALQVGLALGLVGAAVPASDLAGQGPEEMERARTAVQEAFAAREAGDLETARERFQEALRLRPGHPELIYYVAATAAEQDDAGAALRALERLARMGLGFRIEEEPAFTPLRDLTAFRELVGRMEANRRPAGEDRTGTAFVFPGRPTLIPEGIAWDPVTEALLVGSVRERRILRVDSTGRVETFAGPDRSGMMSILGMAADPSRRWLWVTTAGLPQTAGLPEDRVGRSAVLRFDLDTGALLVTYHFPEGGPHRALGDLAVARDGTVYVSDARGAGIYRIRPGGDFLESWIQPGVFTSPQGMALSRDERAVHVADYSRGVFRVDRRGKDVRPLAAPEDVALLGIDGLVAHEGDLLAIQNGTTPHRILRLHLDGEGLRIERVEVLAAAHPDWSEPTLGTLAHGRLLYVANSQWHRFRPDGSLPPPGELQDPRVMWLLP